MLRCPRCGLNSLTVGDREHVRKEWNDQQRWTTKDAIAVLAVGLKDRPKGHNQEK